MAIRWQDAAKGEVSKHVFEYVSSVESSQTDIYERFLRCACLYDPYDRGNSGDLGLGSNRWGGPDTQVSENVCAANVDTVAAIISRAQPRARFMTDDGDWTTQRTARRLEWYAEGLGKQLEVGAKTQRGFKDGAIFGTGLLKIYADPVSSKVVVERVLVDEIVVDEGECKFSPPRQMHQRRLVDRDVLKARWPEKADVIDRAQTQECSIGSGSWRWWAGYRPVESNQIIVIESWQLPIGKNPGRHTVCVDGAELEDEEWTKEFFPFAVFRWSDRTSGWYGIGLVERIAGHQRTLNKLNWQIDRQLDQHAVPTTYVPMGDIGIQVKTTNRLGTIAGYRVAKPETIIPPAVSGETYKRAESIKASSFEESGVSRLAAASMKPAGLESAVALREYKDTTTERFAIQEQAYERFFLDTVWLAIDAAKDLGKDAPTIVRKSRAGTKRLKWADVDMGEVRVQMAAASSLARTPAGRTQTVVEWAQAGVISQDEARRLLQHPDLERAMSLYTAALEDIERCIEDILDGDMLTPEPFQNLKMGIWRFQMAYLKAEGDGASEEILELLRTWIVQASHILLMATQQPEMPAPIGPPAGPMPGGELAPPAGPPPQAAFAPTAMTLQPTRAIG